MRTVGKMTTIEELTASLEIPTRAMGIEHFLCVSAFGFEALQDRTVMFGYLHTDWINHYGNHKYYIDDAIPTHALTLKNWGEPVWWSDFFATHDLTLIQRQVFREAFDYGLKEGLLIPITVAADLDDVVTEYAYVTLGGDITKSDELENTLRLLAIASHGAARRIYEKSHRARPEGLLEDVTDVVKNIDFSKLTLRQKEILSWICEGEGPKQVADRLGIKEGTVQDHLKAVKRTYGFTTTGELTKALHRQRVFI